MLVLTRLWPKVYFCRCPLTAYINIFRTPPVSNFLGQKLWYNFEIFQHHVWGPTDIWGLKRPQAWFRKNEANVWHWGKKIKVRCDAWASFFLKIDMLTLLNLSIYQNVRLGARGQDILAPSVYLNNRLSYGQGQEKWGRLHFFWTRPPQPVKRWCSFYHRLGRLRWS